MQELRVIGVDSGVLLAASEDGTRYRIPIDEALQSRIRQSMPDPGTGPRLSPREIQAHIRAGMSAEDVASITGASRDYIQRFEGPVLAERDFVVQSALAVSVRTAADSDPLLAPPTFGFAIRERLHELGAVDERWASWKDPETGWVVKLAFTAHDVARDARWNFDPKKQTLMPANSEAIALSQHGDVTAILMPRLRAVVEPDAGSTRFDSGAFTLSDSQQLPPTPPGSARPRTKREEPHQPNQTADLLDALRRRRGEREAASFDEADARSAHPSTGGIRILDVPIDGLADETDDGRGPTHTPGRRKGRASMPSWDEIVFGARPDDDPA